VPASALALALAAAFVHACWNLLLARPRDPEAAMAVALVVAVAAFAPIAAVFGHVDSRVWPYVVATGLFELAYFALLAAAYRRLELSVVYPIARGSAPVLVLLAGVVAFGKSTSWGQALGVCLVGVGVVLVSGLKRADRRGIAFGLLIAGCIAAYTLIDKRGIRYASPIAYLELSMLLPSLVYAAVVLRWKGRTAMRAALTWPTCLAGLATFVAYALVLAALRLASAASVAAVRETSVLIAAALAGVFLKERVGVERLSGAALVVAGVALLSLS
jgi:drug/metabolite transporter (DMT)-like permease